MRGLGLFPPRQKKYPRSWEFYCLRGKIWAHALDPEGRGPLQVKTFPSPLRLKRSVHQMLEFQGRPYRGEFWIHAGQDTQCELVNHLDIEDYLKGLVNAEFSSSWQPEAVKAQLIAARTYALHQIRSARKQNTKMKPRHFDLDASVTDQVYLGFQSEDALGSQLVEKSRGWVLTSPSLPGKAQSRSPIKAFYHSSCGGHTRLPEEVWGESYSYLKKSVRCPFCKGAPHSEWRVFFSQTELESHLNFLTLTSSLTWGPWHWIPLLGAEITGRVIDYASPTQDPPRLVDLTLYLQGGGGLRDFKSKRPKLSQISTYWSHAGRLQARMIPLALLREKIGFQRLRSTQLQVRKIQKQGVPGWEFKGLGFGHGVGLCQFGAKSMGEKNFNFSQILSFYYPDAKLERFW